MKTPQAILKNPFLILIAALVTLSSCSKDKDLTAEQVTKNLLATYSPDMVFTLQAGQLIEKSGIREKGMIPGELKFMFGEQLDYILDEEKSGMGFDGKSFLMIKAGKKEFDYIITVFNISNKENFEKMIKEELEMEPEEKDGFMTVRKKNEAIGWYETFGISVTLPRKKKDEVESTLEDLMEKGLEENENVANEYSKLFSDNSDFIVMYKFEPLLSMMKREARGDEKQPIESLMRWVKDSYVFYTFDFGVDKVTAKITNHLNTKTKKEFDSFYRKGIDPSMLDCLTDSALIGFFTCALNPEPVYGFLGELAGKDFKQGEIEFMSKTGMEMINLVKNFTGDFAVSFTGIEQHTYTEKYYDQDDAEETYTYSRPEPVFALTLGIKDSSILVNMADTTKELEKRNGYYSIKGEPDFFISFSSSKLFYTNSEKLVAKFAATGKLSPYNANGQANAATGKTAFGYLDFKSAINAAPENERHYTEAVLKNFEYAVAWGDFNETVYEIHFEKTGKNSLYTITSSLFGLMDGFKLF